MPWLVFDLVLVLATLAVAALLAFRVARLAATLGRELTETSTRLRAALTALQDVVNAATRR